MNTTRGLFLLIASGLTALAADPTLSLSGRWRFRLDRADVGVNERWFERTLPDRIKLPGSLTEQGIGDPVTVETKWMGGIVDKSWFTAPEFAEYRQPGNVKIPFWLQPALYYAGAAWFQRDIEIPEDWEDQRVVLFLERAHWETRVWVDDKLIGTNHSLATPHEYTLGIVARASRPFDSSRAENRPGGTPVPLQLAPGKHTLTIRVDNRMVIDVGENSHCVSDHTQGNWNGIVGEITLRARPRIWVADLRVYPNPTRQSVAVRGWVGNATGQPGEGTLTVRVMEAAVGSSFAMPPTTQMRLNWQAEGGPFECDVAVPAPKPSDEFHIRLYLAEARVAEHQKVMEATAVPFGFRKLSTEGTQISINDRKTFLRGTLDCCIFPKTGHPPMEVEEWRRIIGVAKSYGLNLIRFHSWCPPEAAFQAADQLGFYFQVETCWPNQSTTLGDGKPVDQWIYDETDRILKYYGNHPSFLLMAAGNEPGGKNANAYLAKYVEHFKAKDPRRLWTSGAGWPQLPENQFHVTPDPRIQAWGEGLKSRVNAKPPETLTDYRDYITARNTPVISHEIGQWCVYPNFDEIRKYTGYLQPRNFEIFRERLKANGMGNLAKQFLLASGKLQTLCYKEDIESALRTPGLGGFQLLDLHDFPGQGTALVGVLDPFWEEKGYVSAKEFSRFCNSTVPLARLKKRVFTTEEELEAEIEVAHYGAKVINGASVNWDLVNDEGKVLARGGKWRKADAETIGIGSVVSLGNFRTNLTSFPAPDRYRLIVRLTDLHRYSAAFKPESVGENDWDIWVYPSQVPKEPGDVLVTSQFDEATQARLRSGGKVLLTIPGNQVRNFDSTPVKLGFSSIFWNTAWTGRQAPTTLGILCDPKHPALAQFPTDFHSNWQWWYLLHRAGALRLDLLPKKIEPVVRVIDDWFTARPLGLIIEAKVGAGRMVVCGFDLVGEASADPVSRQLRHSLLAYMESSRFRPKVEIGVEQLRSLIAADQSHE